MKLCDQVKGLLERLPEARDSDVLLYAHYIHCYGEATMEEIKTVMTFLEKFDFNSVSRCRRLVQSKNEELAPSKRVAKLRNEREERAVLTRGSSIADDRRYA